MLVIGISFAFIVFVLLQVGRKTLRTLHLLREPRIEPAELPPLPEAERARRTAALAGLDDLGFVVACEGGYVPSAPPGYPPPPRTWITLLSHPGQTTYANVMVTRSGGADGVPETFSVTTVLRSRLADGRRLVTTSSAARTALPSPRGWVTVREPEARPATLWEAHQRALSRLGAPAVIASIVDEQQEMERLSNAASIDAGALVAIDEHHVRMDGATFAQTLLLALNPVTGEARHPWQSAALFLTLMAVGAASAHIFTDSGFVLGGLFTLLLIANGVFFPKTAGVTMIAIELSGVEAWWGATSDLPLLAAVLAGPTVGTFLARRLGAHAPTVERPWLNTLRMGLMAGGAAVAGAAYLFLRAPRETALPSSAMLAMGLFLLMTALFAPVTLVLMLFPTVRTSIVFQLATVATLSLIPLELAFAAGMVGRFEERHASEENGRALIAAIRAHHGATGAMPRTLRDLVPARLQSVPAPVVGWPGSSFDYAPVDATSFTLSYRSAEGRVIWDERLQRFVSAIAFGSTGVLGPAAAVPITPPSASAPHPAASSAPPVDPLD